MSRKAMVLAAGLGTRMRPLTDTLPKPLIPVAGKALIDRTLDWLAESGVTEAVVNSHYKASMIAAHLEKRQHPVIHLSHEADILETGGGIKNALPLLGDEPFFCINSDVICIDGAKPALHRLEKAWDENRMDALLLLHPVEKAIGYKGPGDFLLTPDGLRRRLDEHSVPLVFTGIQMLHPRLFENAPAGAFSLNVLYNRAMHKDGTLSRVASVIHEGEWLHVGDLEGLAEAEKFLNRRAVS